ncbi:hypothetical protein ACH3XW_46955 [Acanthocheilonema viteae]
MQSTVTSLKRSGILDITEFHGKPLHYYLLNFGPEYSAVHGSYETAPHVGLLHFATENDSAEDGIRKRNRLSNHKFIIVTHDLILVNRCFYSGCFKNIKNFSNSNLVI